MRKRSKARTFVSYLFLILLAYIMIYPLLWMLGAAFKTNAEIFGTISLLPKEPVYNAWADGWRGSGQYTFGRFWRTPS